MRELEKLVNDYHYASKVIEFLEWEKENTEFRVKYKNEAKEKLIVELRKLKPEEIRTVIQTKLLSTLLNEKWE